MIELCPNLFAFLCPTAQQGTATKGFGFYCVTFDLCRFCTFLNLAQTASWEKFRMCRIWISQMWCHKKQTLWQVSFRSSKFPSNHCIIVKQKETKWLKMNTISNYENWINTISKHPMHKYACLQKQSAFFQFCPPLSDKVILPTKFNQSIKGKGSLEWPSYWTYWGKYDLHKMAMKVSLMQKEMQLRTLDCSRITQVLDRRANLIIRFMERVSKMA